MKRRNKRPKFVRLKAFIHKEMQKLDRLMEEAENTPLSTSHPRRIGSLLHDFYTGIERVFERVAANLDGEIPRGECKLEGGKWELFIL